MISVLPAYCEKSTTTSARSAGASSSEWLETLPMLKVVGSRFQSIGWFGITAGAGRNPPSVPIWIHSGPAVAGSGTPPSRPSVGQSSGKPAVGAAGTILTSVLVRPSLLVVVPSASYICRFQKRSLAAFSMRRRYDFGWTVTDGNAVPLTIGVSMKDSPGMDGFGVPGISGGSQGAAIGS